MQREGTSLWTERVNHPQKTINPLMGAQGAKDGMKTLAVSCFPVETTASTGIVKGKLELENGTLKA